MPEAAFSLKGGATVGAVNASWPMATLEVSAAGLVLRVKLVGTYELASHDVVSLEPHGVIPVIGKGIRIVHRKADYSDKLIFWSTEKPEELLARIRDAGFVPSAPSGAPPGAARRSGSFVRAALLLFALATLVSYALSALLGAAE